MADEMTREQLRERAETMLSHAEKNRRFLGVTGEAEGHPTLNFYAEECEVLRFAIAALSAPAPAALSDEELRAEVSRLVKASISRPESLPALRDDSRVSLGATLGEHWVFFGEGRRALLMIHAALTLLAGENGPVKTVGLCPGCEEPWEVCECIY